MPAKALSGVQYKYPSINRVYSFYLTFGCVTRPLLTSSLVHHLQMSPHLMNMQLSSRFLCTKLFNKYVNIWQPHTNVITSTMTSMSMALHFSQVVALHSSSTRTIYILWTERLYLKKIQCCKEQNCFCIVHFDRYPPDIRVQDAATLPQPYEQGFGYNFLVKNDMPEPVQGPRYPSCSCYPPD